MLININLTSFFVKVNQLIDEILWSSPDEHFGATLINIDQPWINID